MSYEWDEYLNDQGDILRGENPAWQDACAQIEEAREGIKEFAQLLLDQGAKLMDACKQENTDKMHEVIDTLQEYNLDMMHNDITDLANMEVSKYDLC